MLLHRRAFLNLGLGTLAAAGFSRPGASAQPPPTDSADYTIRIAAGLVELAPNRIVSTTLYNGQFPGPLIRLREGRPAVVDVVNDTDVPEQLHWHGQLLPADVDGSAAEGTPFVPPHGRRRLSFTPGPAGLRLYHTHTFAGTDLRAGQYAGLVGPVYIEPRDNPGAYDREVFLVLKELSPFLMRRSSDDQDFLLAGSEDAALVALDPASRSGTPMSRMAHELEVAYQDFTINGKRLGDGEPIRVRRGERVLLHVINGSATDTRTLALTGHLFHVTALDGNPVPVPRDVEVLCLAPGERITARVDMDHPGVWILGDRGEARFGGLGVVVEYAGAGGEPQWIDPPLPTWDYTQFGRRSAPVALEEELAPEEDLEMLFTGVPDADGLSRWSINGAAFSATMAGMKPAFSLRLGGRYRLRLRNASAEIHPLHLHRHIFELTRVAGLRTSGIMKDVVMIGPYQQIDVDFTATSPGLSLFHCHMQNHMDYGFMTLFDCR